MEGPRWRPRGAGARAGTARDMAWVVASMSWQPTLTGEAPTVQGYLALTTDPAGATTSMGRMLPSLWYSAREESKKRKVEAMPRL